MITGASITRILICNNFELGTLLLMYADVLDLYSISYTKLTTLSQKTYRMKFLIVEKFQTNFKKRMLALLGKVAAILTYLKLYEFEYKSLYITAFTEELNEFHVFFYFSFSFYSTRAESALTINLFGLCIFLLTTIKYKMSVTKRNIEA